MIRSCPAIRVVEVEAQQLGLTRSIATAQCEARQAFFDWKCPGGVACSCDFFGIRRAVEPQQERLATPGQPWQERYCWAGLRGRIERRPLDPAASLSHPWHPPAELRSGVRDPDASIVLTFLYRLSSYLLKSPTCVKSPEHAGHTGFMNGNTATATLRVLPGKCPSALLRSARFVALKATPHPQPQ